MTSEDFFLYGFRIVADLCDCGLDFIFGSAKIFAPTPREFLVRHIDAISDRFDTRRSSHTFNHLYRDVRAAIPAILEFGREASAGPRDKLLSPLKRQLFESRALRTSAPPRRGRRLHVGAYAANALTPSRFPRGFLEKQDQLSFLAPRRDHATNAVVFRFGAESCSPKSFGYEAAL